MEQQAVSMISTVGRVEAARAKCVLLDYIDSWTLAGSDEAQMVLDEAQSEAQPVGKVPICGAS